MKTNYVIHSHNEVNSLITNSECIKRPDHRTNCKLTIWWFKCTEICLFEGFSYINEFFCTICLILSVVLSFLSLYSLVAKWCGSFSIILLLTHLVHLSICRIQNTVVF